MDINAVLAELRSAVERQEKPDGYFTTKEYMEMLGLGEKAVRRRLQAIADAGRLDAIDIHITGMGGRKHVSHAYRILDPEEVD